MFSATPEGPKTAGIEKKSRGLSGIMNDLLSYVYTDGINKVTELLNKLNFLLSKPDFFTL